MWDTPEQSKRRREEYQRKELEKARLIADRKRRETSQYYARKLAQRKKMKAHRRRNGQA